ncbi:stage IV sporulation protein B [Thermosediminibacter oceani DSM 16646]|uniref:Stage IV sporulation protein B n=1 Tax=Thermosediminibacter oceani (strain ATCC BAA-1034 / DSM 16646 / JW/IW-1228P) TaxID=555079 RepID=D9S3S9_THEOJ|nr:stage IV sporulation protein B [Thermosediminibacter oceani DSM 16646]
MVYSKNRKLIGVFIAIMITLVAFSPQFSGLNRFPDRIRVIEGKEHTLNFRIPFTLQLFAKSSDYLIINGAALKDRMNVNLKNPLSIKSSRLGTYDLEFRLFGIIPVKKMKLEVLPEVKVIPGGHSIGVKLRPDGVIVVGIASVIDEKGKTSYPAREAGIQVGDTISMVNGYKIYTAEELSRIVNRDEDKIVTLTVKRNGKTFETQLGAVKSRDGIYQIGLWVRDIAAGVGTLTFYDPESGYYGALGHIISDSDTGRIVEVGQGEIIRASITSIAPARKNVPGEKRGVFVEEDRVMGNILTNTQFGIFGRMYEPVKNPYYSEIPVALASFAHEGKAQILTVIDGERIEKFDIEIQKIVRQNFPSTKGMIIKIIDPRLIEKTGGIVQGMSGSPIIQDGYLVGAVTHVFVNDPTRGYGVFAEWMIEEISKLKIERQVSNF